MTAGRGVVLSGMRPTGRLHIGNYWGALKNWVELTGSYDCFYMIADWHMLTTGYGDTSRLQENIREMALDWLAAGLDPRKCVIFKQSDVPEHAELALMLGMVTPLSWLENNPTWKEQLQELAKTKHANLAKGDPALVSQRFPATKSPHEARVEKSEAPERGDFELRTYGFLGYPVLQTADILLYRGTKVPVGQDQLPHVELSREIVRRFNNAFGEIFTEPQPLLTPTPRIPGADGRKMSKSYGNTVEIAEAPETLQKKVMAMYTDPLKARANDPGHPLPCAENPPGCVVYALHTLYGTREFAARRETECKQGQIGCVACKKDLLSHMDKPFAEFRAARERCASDPQMVAKVLEDGARRARAVAQKTMADVRRAARLA